MAIPMFLVKSGLRLLLILSALLVVSCEEEGPDIRLTPPDGQQGLVDTTFMASSDTPAQTKRLLVEDFTAVRCNNCPKAANVIKSLKAEYGDTVIALGIHCNRDFSRPYEASDEDYRLEKGQAIYEWFDRPPQPSGMLDRHNFPGKSEVVLDYQSWESLAPKRLNQQPKANIYLKKNLSRKEQEVKVTVRTRFQASLTNTAYLSLMITEDKIEDVQLGPDQKRPDYEHNHVVRHIQTPAQGLTLVETPREKQVVAKGFVMPLKDNWKLPDLNIVAFVHVKDSQGPVLQTRKISVN